MNKNILICLNKLDIGGIETAVVNQVYEMLEKKYNVIVVAKSGIYTEKIKEKGAICIDFCFEIEDGYNLEKSKEIEEIIKKYKIGQVHIHQFDCITSVFPACINTNTKYISYIHTGVEGTYDWFEKHYKSYKVIFNMYYNMADKIIAITEKAKEENRLKYNVDEKKYIIINNSLKFDEKIMKNEKYPKALNNFLILSRFAPEKRISIINAIELFKRYSDLNKEAKLTIVGDGEDKKFILDKLKDIEDKICILGARNDVVDIIKENDVIIGLDRCILEAIALKKIAIISGYKKMKGMVTPDNIEIAAKENFSGENLNDVTIDDVIKALQNINIDDIQKFTYNNFEFSYKNLNIENNVYLLEDINKETINIDKKIYFENIDILLKMIKDEEEKTNKIYKDSKEAQKYFESQIKNLEENMEFLNKENEKLKVEEIKMKKYISDINNNKLINIILKAKKNKNKE